MGSFPLPPAHHPFLLPFPSTFFRGRQAALGFRVCAATHRMCPLIRRPRDFLWSSFNERKEGIEYFIFYFNIGMDNNNDVVITTLLGGTVCKHQRVIVVANFQRTRRSRSTHKK
jgi:hypothetical protein